MMALNFLSTTQRNTGLESLKKNLPKKKKRHSDFTSDALGVSCHSVPLLSRPPHSTALFRTLLTDTRSLSVTAYHQYPPPAHWRWSCPNTGCQVQEVNAENNSLATMSFVLSWEGQTWVSVKTKQKHTDLERWLNTKGHLLLLQRTQVWFPVPLYSRSKLFILLVSGVLIPSDLVRHSHSETHPFKVNRSKSVNNKTIARLGMLVTLYPLFWKQRQEGHLKFKSSLGYILASSYQPGLQGEPLSQIKQSTASRQTKPWGQ